MSGVDDLLARNRAWATRMEQERPGYFARLAKQQRPRYMWVGCSDSRVPANQITGLEPGEVFVHRNVGNLLVHSDLNALSALQFAVDVLRVRHVIVVGHHGCGAVLSALQGKRLGLVDNWVRHIQDVRDRHRDLLDALPPGRRADALVELNVIEQVHHICTTTVVGDAWVREHALAVHGWAYSLQDGLLQDLHMRVTGRQELEHVRCAALDEVRRRHGRAPARLDEALA